MKRRSWIRVVWFSGLVVWACGGAATLEHTDSETHWLSRCDTSADCQGDGTCSCGFCTTACSVSGGCGAVSDTAVCLEASAVELCAEEASPPSRLCVEQCDTATDCPDGFSCFLDACVQGTPSLAALPDGGTSDAGAGRESDGGSADPLLQCAEPGIEAGFDSDAEFMAALVGRWLTCGSTPNFLGDGSEDGFDVAFDESTQQYVFHTLFSAGVTGPDLRWSDAPSSFGTVTLPGFVIGETREIDFNFASGEVASVLMGQLVDPKKLTVLPGAPQGVMPSSHVFGGLTAAAPAVDGGGTDGLDAGGLGGSFGEITTVVPSSGCGTAPPADGTYTIPTFGTKAADCANATCGPWTSDREYSIFLPSGYDPNRPYMLVFEGPGCGGSSTAIYPYDNNANNTIIRVGVRPSEEVHLSHALYPGQGCFDTHDGDDSVDWVLYEALYDLLETQLCFDRNRVFAGGNSLGAFFANELGCKYAGDPERPIRGVLPNAGGLPSDPQHMPTCTTAGMAGIWIHEVDDATIPFQGDIDAINRAMAVSGCAAGQTYDAATFEDFPIGGGQPNDTCKKILGCDPLYPLVVCALSGNEHGAHDNVVNPGVSTFLQSFLTPPLSQ